MQIQINTMHKEITLTNGAITYITSLKKEDPSNKEPISINTCLLKIEAISTKASVKGNLLVLTLSDGVNKNSNFYFCRKDVILQVNDVIELSSITISVLQSNHTLYFIKKIDQIYHNPIIRDPTEIRKDEHTYHSSSNNDNNDDYTHDNTHMYDVDINQYTPLSSLTTFTKSYKIYFKVISKSEIRKFTNSKGGGKIFSFTIQDKDGYEMQGIAFGDACEKVDKQLHKGKYYETKSGYVRMSRRKGGPNSSDYCINFEETSVFTEMPEICKFEHAQVNVVAIKDIYELNPGMFVDVVGVVTNQNETKTITIKSSNQTRDTKKITLGDISGNSIELTIWGDKARDNYDKDNIFLFRKVRVHEYKEIKSLNTTEDTEIVLNPKSLPQYEELKTFIQNGGVFKQAPVFSVVNENITSEKLFLDQIHANVEDIFSREGSVDAKLYPIVRFVANVFSISKYDKNYYYGCPDKNCKKKLLNDISNNYRCSKCNVDIVEGTGVYYYTVNIKVKDSTMDCWVELFGESAEKLLGVECKKYHELVSNNDENQLNEIHDAVMYGKFLFVGKARKILIQNNNVYKTRVAAFSVYKMDEEKEIKLCKERAAMYKQLLLNK